MNYYAITSEFYISINHYILGSKKLFSAALKNYNLSLIELINYSYLNLFLNITNWKYKLFITNYYCQFVRITVIL